MFFVKGSKFSILWNGEKTDMFSAHKGLHQGDPMLPYLFVLCMERLGHLIKQSVGRVA